MPTYGYELRITGPGMDAGSRAVRRVEFEASGPLTAGEMLDGWAAVEGVAIVSRELLADGMTFREAGERRVLDIAGELTQRYGGTVETSDNGPNDPFVARVTLANGKGLSLATGGSMPYDPPPTASAFAFNGDEWIGDPVRSIDTETAASMLADLA